MLPVILAGAALIGGYAIAKAMDSPSPRGARAQRPPAAENAQAVASPQSYVVTPVSGRNPSPEETASIVESVRKFTV